MAGTEVSRGSAADAVVPPIQITAGLVHDLGNLIQIASSAVSIVARSQEVRDANLDAVILGATTSLERAAALVRQGISGARPGAAAGAISVARCLDEVEALVHIAWRAGHVSLEIRAEDGLPDLGCDPLALQNAILNLVFNARDAMPEGGAVVLSAAADVIGNEPAVAIRVIDRGVGMKPETISRARDPFFTTKSDGLGGVGLPMVDEFVRDAGGQMTIESEFGAGTTVTLRLPAIVRRRVAQPPG